MKKYLTRDKILDAVLLAVSIIIIIVGGLVYEKHSLLAISLFIIGILLNSFIVIKQSNIQGDGINKITASKIAPENPKKGDAWLDLN